MQPGKRSGKGLKWHRERRQKVGPQSGQRVFYVDGRTLVWWAPDVGANSKSTSMTTYCLRQADVLMLTGWILAKFEALEWKFCIKLGSRKTNFVKFEIFVEKGVLKNWNMLKWGLNELLRAWKAGLKGRTSPYPFSRWVPPWDHPLNKDFVGFCLKFDPLRNRLKSNEFE